MKRFGYIAALVAAIVLSCWAATPNYIIVTGGVEQEFCIINTNDISFYFRLDEAAGGPFVDATGQLGNLSVNGSPVSYVGKITNCIGFDSTKTQHLTGTVVSDVGNITNGPATVTCWIYTSNNTATQVFVQKGQYDTLSGGWSVSMTAAGLLQMDMLTTNGMGSPATYTASATTFGAISSNTWYFVCGQFSRTSNYLAISVNNGAFNTTSVSSTNSPKPSSVALRIGGSTVAAPPGSNSRVLGMVDEVAKWNRNLSTSEVSCLYHGGSPGQNQTYPFTL